MGAEDGAAVGVSVKFNPGETKSGDSVGSRVIFGPVGWGLGEPSIPPSLADVGSGVCSGVGSGVGSGICSGVGSGVGSGTGGGDGTEGVGGDGSSSSPANGDMVMNSIMPVGVAVSILKAVGDTVGDMEGGSVSTGK